MGFNGGGGGQLLNHTHDGSIPLNGGPLSFQNITQSSMGIGSTTFSDGNHLQELVMGNAGDTLVTNAGATAPEWVASHSIGQYQLIETYKAPAAASTYTFSFPAITPDDASALVLVYSMAATAALNLGLVVENIANNETNYIRIDTAVVTAVQIPQPATELQICDNTLLHSADTTANGLVYIQQPLAPTIRPTITFQAGSQNTGGVIFGGGFSIGTPASFTDIEIKTDVSSWKQDSIFSLYKILR